jgi:aldose 1-epimerase
MNHQLEKFTIRNSKGASAVVSSYGAKLISLVVPDKNGFFRDIVIGFDHDEVYFHHDPYLNSVCGRFAGRIGGSTFQLHDKSVVLEPNEGKNQLHGGKNGFHQKQWNVESATTEKVVLTCFSPDGEGGFPGNLQVWVTYEIDDRNRFYTRFKAKTDQSTIVNLCQHAYFNLNGKDTIYDHQLQIESEYYLVCDEQMIPTGEIKNVIDTILDFRESKGLEKVVQDPFLATTQGLDHCFVLDHHKGDGMERACKLNASESGITMEVFSNQKGLVVYSGNFIEEHYGKGGAINGKHTAICLESQSFPDSPNHEHFPSTVLEPGEEYESIICWKFSGRMPTASLRAGTPKLKMKKLIL